MWVVGAGMLIGAAGFTPGRPAFRGHSINARPKQPPSRLLIKGC